MIQIIDYGAGNIRSVENALKKLGVDYRIVSSVSELKSDRKVIFPGVGAALSAMRGLTERGLIGALKNFKAPVLGICLGMQILLDNSCEGDVSCLGVINGNVKKFNSELGVKVPQIGWNKVKQNISSPLFEGVLDESYFYFVNSYFADVDKDFVLGVTDYGVAFPSVIRKDNFYGVQFHPEKSGEVGLKLLNNFCKLC